MRKFVQAVAILGAGAHRTAWWAGFTVALLILFVQGVGWSGQVVVTLPFTDPPASSSDRNNRDCSDAVAAPYPPNWGCDEFDSEGDMCYVEVGVESEPCDMNVQWTHDVNRTPDDLTPELDGSLRVWIHDDPADYTGYGWAVANLIRLEDASANDQELFPDYYLTNSTELTTGNVLVVSAYVTSDTRGIDPEFRLQFFGEDDDHKTGEVTRSFLLADPPAGEQRDAWDGWHHIEFPAAVPENTQYIKLLFGSTYLADRYVPTWIPDLSAVYLDDVEITEYTPSEYRFRAWPSQDHVEINIEPGRASVLPLGIEAPSLVGEGDDCSALVLFLPEGVEFVAADEAEVEDTLTWFGRTLVILSFTGSASCSDLVGAQETQKPFWEYLYLQGNENLVGGSLITLGVCWLVPAELGLHGVGLAEWDGEVDPETDLACQPGETVTAWPVTVPTVSGPDTLRTDALAWAGYETQTDTWDGYMDLLADTGVHSVTVGASDAYTAVSVDHPDHFEHVQDVLDAADALGLGRRTQLGPFSFQAAEYDADAVAMDKSGEDSGGKTVLCPGIPMYPNGPHVAAYTDELDALAAMATPVDGLGLDWFAFDLEGSWYRTYCTAGLARFHTMYSDPDGDSVIQEWLLGELIGDPGDDPRHFYGQAGCTKGCENFDGNDVYDLRDAQYERFLATAGTTMWTGAYTAIADAMGGVQDARPTLTQWQARPGSFDVSMGWADFDVLYPQVLAAGAPPLYPNASTDAPALTRSIALAGPRVRRSLLGALALGTNNLLSAGHLETGPPLAFPITVDPVGDEDELHWDLLEVITGEPYAVWDEVGGVCDADEGETDSFDWGPFGQRAAHAVRSLRVERRHPGDASLQTRYRIHLGTVYESEDYVFSAAVRHEPAGRPCEARSDLRPCVNVEWFDAADDSLGEGVPDCGMGEIPDTWFRETTLTRAPEGATSADVLLQTVGSKGAVWFDDLIGGRPNRVSNPGMERVSGNLPESWTKAAGGATFAVVSSTSQARTGDRSLRMGPATSPAISTSGQAAQNHVLPVSKITGWEGVVPYQLGASVYASGTSTATVALRVEWLASDQTTAVGTPSETTFTPGQDAWVEHSLSVLAPADARYARTLLKVDGLSVGSVWFDDVDLRLDGPYVVPFVTAGWVDQELDPREVREQLLESFGNGAQGVSSYTFLGWSAADLTASAGVSAALSQVEDILLNGRPIAWPRLCVAEDCDAVPPELGWDPLLPRVVGTEWDGRAVVVVSDYRDVEADVPVRLSGIAGVVSRFDDEGEPESVDQLGGEYGDEFTASFLGEGQEARAQVFLVQD